MNSVNYSKDLFESIAKFRKLVLLKFLIKDDRNLLLEIGFSERDINRLKKEYKSILVEEYENYSDYIEDQESILEKFLNK